MYYFIYDASANQKKYSRQVDKIEAELANLGIAGKSFRLTVLSKIEDIIEEAVISGIKNIVAVGNDQTVSRVANLLVEKDLALGIIPFGGPNRLAQIFGINSYTAACRILSARKLARLDVGQVNEQYFFLALEPESRQVEFTFSNFKIRPLSCNAQAGIYNINIDRHDFRSDPEDGVMEAVFTPVKKSWYEKIFSWGKNRPGSLSVFPIKELVISHLKKPVAVSLDRQRILKTPLTVKVLSRKLKIIVGKERIFDPAV